MRSIKDILKRPGDNRLLITILVCLVVTSCQFASIFTKEVITDDEGISYIAATGHQGIYDQERPKGKWILNTEWKKLWEPDERFCFRTIGKDLAYLDIHPPLYFWILHVWLLIFNTGILTGPMLNMIIYIVIFFLIYKTGIKIFQNFRVALASAFVWGISPAVMEYVRESRQYTLLALCTIVFLELFILSTEEGKRNKILIYTGLAITSTAGMLTHYYFSLLIGGSSVILILAGIKSNNWKPFLHFILYEITGLILFLILHPWFFHSFLRQQDQAEAFNLSDVLYRVKRSITTFGSYYFPDNLTKPGVILLTLLFLLALILYISKKQWRKELMKGLLFQQKVVLYYFVFLLLSITGLYVLFVSPQHAMRAKYLSMIHIFIVYSTFIIIYQIKTKYNYHLVWIVCIWQFLMSAWFIKQMYDKSQYYRNFDLKSLQKSSRILLDNDERGVVPTVLFYFPDSINVFALNQDNLLKETRTWLNELDTNSIYISDLRYDNTLDKRLVILDSITAAKLKVSDSAEFRLNGESQIYLLKHP